MKVSVAILAKNEATMLPDALASVVWADQVVVGVDSTTTDNTAEIARKAGAKVIDVTFDKGFGDAKNQVLAACSSDWVFILDADERVVPELQAEIEALVPTDGVGGYRLKRRNFTMGYELKNGGWQNDTQLRIVPQSARYQGVVHEEIEVSGQVVILEHALIHHSHRTVSGFIKTINLYTDLEAERYDGAVRGGVRGLLLPGLKEFYHRYWRLRGYRDGTVGLFEAVMSGFYFFTIHAKVWERHNKR